MNGLLIILCFVLSFPTSEKLAHDFHLSKTDIHYKSDQQALQFTIHIFLDDLELAIKTKYGEDLSLFSKNENPKSDSLVYIYLSEKLNVDIEGQSLLPDYLGKEISDDLSTAWIYLEAIDIMNFKNLMVSNEILLEIFDDQKNLVNLKKDSKMKAFHILDHKERNKLIKL